MSKILEPVATVVVALAALAVSGSYLWRNHASPPSRAKGAEAIASPEARWSMTADVALPARRQGRAVQLIEFIDLECPFCARYHSTIDSIAVLLADSVQIRYVNLPIEGHRFAPSGGGAVECAFARGIGEQFVSTVFRLQDSIGFLTWPVLAKRAGLLDTAGFQACVDDPHTRKKVDSAVEVAKLLEVRGTPSVLLDGQRYDRPPKLDRLLSDIRRISRSGERP